MEMGDDDDGNVNRKVQSIVPLSHIRYGMDGRFMASPNSSPLDII